MSKSPPKKHNNDNKMETNEDGICKALLNTKLKKIAKVALYLTIPILLSYQYSSRLNNFIRSPSSDQQEQQLTYWVYSMSSNTDHLKHVFAVLDRIGFKRGSNESDWDLLWAHDYPYRALQSSLRNLKPHQRVNHFPGCGYITNKVDLSTTSEVEYNPKAFKMPEEKNALLRFASENPDKSFVQKSNAHRGIEIRKVEEIDMSNGETFVQEFIDKPFLVDGYKFDIGVYTAITSVDPLRIYVYKADVLFRFCPVKYYPFDPKNLDKYVVGDDYLPIWNVPSLRNYYTNLGFSMKDSFDAYAISRGKNPQKMWEDVYDAIRRLALSKEKDIAEVAKRFGKKNLNFFELVRVDFTIDEDLNVFLMEANMSPNLSSAHFAPNQLLYEQVIFNFFALVGLAQRTSNNSLKPRMKEEREMEVADKNLVVLPEICAACQDCFRVECQLCKPCFTEDMRETLRRTYLEHQNKMDFYRIFPPQISRNMTLKDYTLRNQLLVRWFQGKCEMDETWCD